MTVRITAVAVERRFVSDAAGTLHTTLNTQHRAISLCLLQEDGAAPGGRFDLVMANILRGPLLELQPRLTGYCRPGGRLVLSGILQEQVCLLFVCWPTFT